MYDLDEDINYLYELRHSSNVFGDQYVADLLNIQVKKVIELRESNVHGSKKLDIFLKASKSQFKELIQQFEEEEYQRQLGIYHAKIKNQILINSLKEKRKNFAGIGTNKAKRRLNKLAKTDPIAQATRLAIEIEDKNISAKEAFGTFKDRIYNIKASLILDLCLIFKENSWTYGIQEDNTSITFYVIYFEIPGCEQISWHYMPLDPKEFPIYNKTWDQKENSTLLKLENITKKLLKNNQ